MPGLQEYERKPTDRFTSQSMAKSIVSLGIGLALAEGKIASLDDNAEKYAPKLRGTVLGETTIRNLLREVKGEGDTGAFWQVALREGVERAARFIKEREYPQGERFYYMSPNSVMLGAVLRGATWMSVCDWLSPRLWQAIGAEETALWRTDKTGLELANGNFNATLRDYGRLGMGGAQQAERAQQIVAVLGVGRGRQTSASR